MVNKIYALIGPFASGRRTLAMQLSRIGVHYIPTYTTKPTDPKDTHPGLFRPLPQEEFDKQDFMLRASYQGFYYGLTKTDVLQALKNYHASIIILDTGSIAPLSRLLRENLVTIYLMVDYVTLVGRMLTMGCTNDDIKARPARRARADPRAHGAHASAAVRRTQYEAALNESPQALPLGKADT